MRHVVLGALVLVALSTFLPSKKQPQGTVADALSSASRADKATVRGIYTALGTVTERDAGRRVKTMAQWRQAHGDVLAFAVGEMKGKYPGLDVAVESVFAAVGPSLDNTAIGPEQTKALVTACTEVSTQSE
jgi:hypothetical protein